MSRSWQVRRGLPLAAVEEQLNQALQEDNQSLGRQPSRGQAQDEAAADAPRT